MRRYDLRYHPSQELVEYTDISAIVARLIEPANALFLTLLVATLLLWSGKWQSGRWIVTIAVLSLGVLVIAPIGTLLLMPLEQRFPMPRALPAKVDGIVMLGGAQQPQLSKARGVAALNERAERLTTFLALARSYPFARLVASGGGGRPQEPDVNEAATTRMFLHEQGFDVTRVLFEARSGNTYENAIFSKQLAEPRAHETWLLITSAADLPRAMGVFRKNAWPVLPVPCDYETARPDWTPSLDLLSHLRLINHAVHEWVGLAFYFVAGRTDDFFPAPDENTEPKQPNGGVESRDVSLQPFQVILGKDFVR